MDMIKWALSGAIILLLLLIFVIKPFGHFLFVPLIWILVFAIFGVIVYFIVRSSE